MLFTIINSDSQFWSDITCFTAIFKNTKLQTKANLCYKLEDDKTAAH